MDDAISKARVIAIIDSQIKDIKMFGESWTTWTKEQEYDVAKMVCSDEELESYRAMFMSTGIKIINELKLIKSLIISDGSNCTYPKTGITKREF